MTNNPFEISRHHNAEIRASASRILKIGTRQINEYLGLEMKEPTLTLKYDEGPSIQTQIIDGLKTGIVLRPEVNLRRQKTLYHSPEALIHDLVHISEDSFLGLPPDTERKADTAVYLSEGFANFVATNDVAKIFEKLGSKPKEDFSTRIRNELENNPRIGKLLIDSVDLDKLYSVRQFDLEQEDINASAELSAKELIPYWIGATLIGFIFEKGGVGTVRKIMRQVQVNKKFAYGWEIGTPTEEKLKQEENRVRTLLKKVIEQEFGDLDKFEKEWKQFVLNERN